MYLNRYKVNFLTLGILSLVLAMVSSCSVSKRTTVKNYPHNKPFVYDTKINLKGDIAKDEKKRLTTELENYWDDSLKLKKIQQFWIIYKIKNPPAFDSNNIYRSVNFMNAYLNSQGYYYANFENAVRIDTVSDQIRASVAMDINIGKNIRIDSVSYNLADTNLQKLTKTAESKTLLKKGAPYTKQLISSELDRLVSLYRQNGYYRFTREDVYALVDTTNTKLLQLTLDPFKQAEIIAEAARARRENPTWDISILKRPTLDSSRLAQYHIGRVYYYPESRLTDITDSIMYQKGFQEITRRNLTMRYRKGLFTYQPLREHTYLHNGELYNENNYFKSINTLGQLGAWQQVDARPVVRDKDSLDLYFYLIPAVKQSFTIDLESSRSPAAADIGSGNLWGISTNLAYNNKNVWKSAIQSLATFRTGVELSLLSNKQTQLIQTFLINIGHTYAFPKLILPFKIGDWRTLSKLDNKKTLFSVNGSYVDRRDYYQLRSLVTSWGYEWKKGDNVWLYKPLNVELYSLDTLAGLRKLFATSPFLRTSFNSGKVISQRLTLIKNFTNPDNPDKSHFIRLGLEEAGGLLGLIGKWNEQIYRFLKVEAEYRKSVRIRKTELAYRAYAGVGYNYGTDTARDKTLPFFKQFFAGGPYSMRAWGLRQLGLGSSVQSEIDTSNNSYHDRFGDMQLEANIEYRFPLTTIAGVKVASAVYADIGNVWNIKKNAADPEARFAFNNLGRDIAIGVGTGVRVDFSYFLIRLDFAYKVKDPARKYNNGWMDKFQWFENRENGLRVNNYAVQLGIGLPF